MKKAERCLLLFQHDTGIWQQGRVFAGIDEAGRGPLAGPVSAACVMMPKDSFVEGIDDSKKMSEKKREAMFEEIAKVAEFIGIGWASVQEIEEFNILEATKLAMKRAASGAPVDLFLIDAVRGLGLSGDEWPLISGDATSYSIAAASIVAKVARDRRMCELDALYPAYGFASNKGYGSKAHIDAIREHGPTPEHRMSFLGRILSS